MQLLPRDRGGPHRQTLVVLAIGLAAAASAAAFIANAAAPRSAIDHPNDDAPPEHYAATWPDMTS